MSSAEARDLSPAQVKALWHQIKAQEKADKAAARRLAGLPERPRRKGVLAGVTQALPALTRAWKLQARASTVGFDWNDARLVLDKVREETAEIDEALASGDKAAIVEEIGDLLFVVANLARHVDADPKAVSTPPTRSSSADSRASNNGWRRRAGRLRRPISPSSRRSGSRSSGTRRRQADRAAGFSWFGPC